MEEKVGMKKGRAGQQRRGRKIRDSGISGEGCAVPLRESKDHLGRAGIEVAE